METGSRETDKDGTTPRIKMSTINVFFRSGPDFQRLTLLLTLQTEHSVSIMETKSTVTKLDTPNRPRLIALGK